MNTYEALIVFKPAIDMENPEGSIKTVENAIQNLKGKIVKMDKVGRKRLAYEIAKFKDGYITTIWFQLPNEAVAEFKKICQINEEILRLTLIRMDDMEFAIPGTTSTVTNQPGMGGRDHRDRDHHHRGDRDFRGGDRDFRGGDREHRGDRPDFRGGDNRGGEHRGDREQRPAPTQPSHQS